MMDLVRFKNNSRIIKDIASVVVVRVGVWVGVVMFEADLNDSDVANRRETR